MTLSFTETIKLTPACSHVSQYITQIHTLTEHLCLTPNLEPQAGSKE